MKKRLVFADIARGIAIICIILGHLGQPGINRVVYTFHVPVFFLITGYFINESESFGVFLKKRVRSLLLPYAVTALLCILLGGLSALIRGESVFSHLKIWTWAAFYGAGDEYSEPFFIKSIGAIWFLLAAFWGSLVLFFSLKCGEKPQKLIVKRDRKKPETISSEDSGQSQETRMALICRKVLPLLLIAAAFAAGYFTTRLFWFPFSIQAGLCAAIYMYIGRLVRREEQRLRALPAAVWFMVLLLAVVIWAFFIRDFRTFWLVHCDFGRFPLDFIGSLAACTCIFALSVGIEHLPGPLSRILAFFGENSIVVLCVHLLEMNFFPWPQLIEKAVALGLPGRFSFAFYIAARLLLVLGISAALIPLHQKLRRKG